MTMTTKAWLTECKNTLLLFLFCVLITPPLLADKVDPKQKTEDDPQTEDNQQTSVEEIPQLAGPNGVFQELKLDEERRNSFVGHDLFKPWFDWKQEQQDEHGLALGFKAWFLIQAASESLSDSNDAAGAIYRLQGSWTAFSGNSGQVGRIEWRVEKRAGLGSMLAPADLSGNIGVAALNTAFGYSDTFTTDISVLNWTQGFRDYKFGYAIGRLASDVYSDSFAFSTFSRGYLNRSFLFNPTQGSTGVGSLGMVAKGFVTDQIWLGAHIYDGNAVSGDFDFDTFKQHEWLKEVEIGWAPSFTRRYTDRIQFLYWHKDERAEAGVSSGKGWVVTASYQVGEKFLSFFRVGSSDGGAGVPAEKAASTGVEFTPKDGQALTLGLGWAKPSEDTYGPGLHDEYVTELSYRFQLTKSMSLLSDLQLVLNPALNPAKDRVWVLGFRASLAL
jgi:porin